MNEKEGSGKVTLAELLVAVAVSEQEWLRLHAVAKAQQEVELFLGAN